MQTNKFNFIIALALMMSSLKAQSQQYFYNDKYYDNPILLESGMGTGFMNCLTDIGGKKGPGKPFIRDLNLHASHPCFSAYLNWLFNYQLGFRLQFQLGRVSANDHDIKNDQAVHSRYHRNLQFASSIREFALLVELHPMELAGFQTGSLSAYILAGLGYFQFNPKAMFNNNWIELNPLHTEGQGFSETGASPYKLKQLNIPFGVGWSFEMNAIVWLRLELLHRFLFTDYLDDVSGAYIDPQLFSKYLPPGPANLARKLADRRSPPPGNAGYAPNALRGNSSRKDSYLSAEFKIGFILNRSKR